MNTTRLEELLRGNYWYLLVLIFFIVLIFKFSIFAFLAIPSIAVLWFGMIAELLFPRNYLGQSTGLINAAISFTGFVGFVLFLKFKRRIPKNYLYVFSAIIVFMFILTIIGTLNVTI